MARLSRKETAMSRIPGLLLTLAASFYCCHVAMGQAADPFGAGVKAADKVEAPLVTKFYDITPLVTARRHFGFHDGSIDGLTAVGPAL
jgi:hypothetical protein